MPRNKLVRNPIYLPINIRVATTTTQTDPIVLKENEIGLYQNVKNEANMKGLNQDKHGNTYLVIGDGAHTASECYYRYLLIKNITTGSSKFASINVNDKDIVVKGFENVKGIYTSVGNIYDPQASGETGDGYTSNIYIPTAKWVINKLNELKKSVSDGKSAVSSAITSMGVSTAADASYEDMRNNILKIKPTIDGSWLKNQYTADAYINGKNSTSITTSIPIMKDYMLYNGTCGFNSYATPENNLFNNNNNKSSNDKYFWVGLGNAKWQNVCLSSVNNYILVPSDRFGNANVSDILSGKTATTKEGYLINGSMVNRGAVNKTIGCSQSYTIPKGYHNGSGKVTTRSLTYETSDGFPASNIKQLFPPTIKAYTRGKLVEGKVSTTYMAEAWYYIMAAPNPYTEWTNINTDATIFFNTGSDWGTNHKISSDLTSGVYIFQADSAAVRNIFLNTQDPRIDVLVESSDNLNYIKGYNIIHLAPKGAIYLYSPNWAVGKNRAVFIYSKWWTRDNSNDEYYYLYDTTSCILVADPMRVYSFKVYIDSECTTEIELNIQFNAETGVLCVYNTSSDRYLMNDIWIQKVN